MSTPGMGSGARPPIPLTISQIANRNIPALRVVRIAIPSPPIGSHLMKRVRITTRTRSRSDVLRLRPDQMILRMLLDDVRAPSRAAPAGEQRREGCWLEANGLQHERRIELDVGLEMASRLDLVEHAQHRLLDLACQVE